MLFDCTSDNISVHLQNIYETDELKKEATTEKISVVRREGNRDVNRTQRWLSCQLYPCHSVPAMGYECTAGICHSWLCVGQKTHGEWYIPG